MLRKAFKTGAWKLWSVKRLQKLGSLLQSHHGSSIPKYVKQKLTQRANTLTMLNAWKCRFCWVQVEGHLTHCKGCNRHWRQADYVSNPKTANGRATRSQSKRRHSRQESNSKDVENPEKNKSKEEEMVFTSKLPWVVNSPQTRVTTVEIPAAEATETAASTEPQMPASPNVEEDINQVLQHLRGLKQALGSLPRELEEKLQTYEERIKDRALTHGHLNRLGKITKQLKGIATRLTAMDEGWISFSKRVKDKYEHHKVLYHQSTSCKGADPAGIPPALSGCLAQSASCSTSHGCSGRCVQRNNGGGPNDSRGNGSHVSIEYPTRSNGWDGGDLRGWSEGYRSTKAVSKERCTQAIQSCGSTFSEQGCPTAFETEGSRQGEEQGWKSYYTELNDIGIDGHDDSLETLLQNGPDCIQNGIVTFCDQVEIQEYVPDDTDPSESRSDMGGIDIGDQLSEGVCSMCSDAPCQFDRWCAKLHSAAPSEFLDHEDELQWDENFDREFDVDTHSLMQAHHFTSNDRVNLRALVEAAPTVGEFLVTIWAIEFGMGSSTSATIRLHRDQEDTWVSSILASKPPVFRGGTIADKKEPQIIVVDPQPSSPTDRASPSSGTVNLHVIVDTFSHNCVPVLLDRVREGQWVDRKPYAMRVNTVADIFHRVGWRQDLLRSDARCSLDDAGILYDPEDEVVLYGGYFGTLHVASIDRDSSSTSYGTCESDLDDIEVRGFDDVALFQTFARFMDWEWQKVEGRHEHESSLKEWSCRNEREDHDDQLPIPGDDEGEEEEGDVEQDEESPDLLDIPVMSRAWIEIEDAIRANSQGETGYPPGYLRAQ